MKFRFEFDIKKFPWPIEHRQKLLLIGSCFTENMGEKLRRYKFSVMENPHGILFNPVSVVNAIDDYISSRTYTESDLFHFNEGWHSWNHHSRYSGLTAEESLTNINESVSEAGEYLRDADVLLITLGSAWVYRLTDKAVNGKPGCVAANNHKAPADWFIRELADAEFVKSLLANMIERLQPYNKTLKIIFTISPVRHLREGVIDNNRSKAVLIQAVHDVVAKHDHLYYFPAYELVLDDLRDYRFYAEDLVHPNYFATQYVWKRFVEACISDGARNVMEEIRTINLAFQHKPFNPTSDQHRKFLKVHAEKVKRLLEKHPDLDFRKELDYFQGSV